MKPIRGLDKKTVLRNRREFLDDLKQRMVQHTNVNGMAVCVLTPRELEAIRLELSCAWGMTDD